MHPLSEILPNLNTFTPQTKTKRVQKWVIYSLLTLLMDYEVAGNFLYASSSLNHINPNISSEWLPPSDPFYSAPQHLLRMVASVRPLLFCTPTSPQNGCLRPTPFILYPNISSEWLPLFIMYPHPSHRHPYYTLHTTLIICVKKLNYFFVDEEVVSY